MIDMFGDKEQRAVYQLRRRMLEFNNKLDEILKVNPTRDFCADSDNADAMASAVLGQQAAHIEGMIDAIEQMIPTDRAKSVMDIAVEIDDNGFYTGLYFCDEDYCENFVGKGLKSTQAQIEIDVEDNTDPGSELPFATASE